MPYVGKREKSRTSPETKGEKRDTGEAMSSGAVTSLAGVPKD